MAQSEAVNSGYLCIAVRAPSDGTLSVGERLSSGLVDKQLVLRSSSGQAAITAF